jgi:hypothetical protein
MAGTEFSLPGSATALAAPDTYVTGVLRSFGKASTALGAATEALVVRLAAARGGEGPDYQIQTVDGEDIAAFSGKTHDFLNDDITVPIDEDRLLDAEFSMEDVKDWLNAINGEGAPGGPLEAGR